MYFSFCFTLQKYKKHKCLGLSIDKIPNFANYSTQKEMTYLEFKHKFKEQLSGMFSEQELKVILAVLVKKFCGIEQHIFHISGNISIHPTHLYFLNDSIEKLKRHIPTEYITGECEFLNLNLWVNESVLIPRPETEELVMHLSEYFKKTKKTPLQIIDLGTGSGCIAISLKQLFPTARVIATDISEGTLTTARFNSNMYQSNIEFFNHDMLKQENLPIESDFDAIVSNPPYVLKEESEFMSLHVLDNEPHIALFAMQSQPLAYYHHLKDYVIRYLKPGGFFIFEINESLGQETKEIFSYQNEYITEILLLNDAFGKTRFISGTKTMI